MDSFKNYYRLRNQHKAYSAYKMKPGQDYKYTVGQKWYLNIPQQPLHFHSYAGVRYGYLFIDGLFYGNNLQLLFFQQNTDRKDRHGVSIVLIHICNIYNVLIRQYNIRKYGAIPEGFFN